MKTTKLEAQIAKALPQMVPTLQVLGTYVAPQGQPGASLMIEARTPSGRTRQLYLDIKSLAVPSRIRERLRQLKSMVPRSSGYPVLASTFLSPRVRTMCREEGIGYLDLAGNCLLQLDDCYVERIVDRNPFPKRGRPASLFAPISSRLLRALLEEPRRPWTLKDLAAASDVSLGQASNVCRRLMADGYAARTAEGIKVAQPGALLDAWRDAYPASSAPHAYYSFEREPQRLMARIAAEARQRQWRYAVTSFSAASLIAPFVHGVGVVQAYVDPLAVDDWVQALDLRPVEAGPNVLLVVPYDTGVFYRARTVQDVQLVGAIQLYLDLYSDPARGREQAEFLRQQVIGF